MATNFPNSLDSFTNPVGSNNLSSPSHADQHANVNDAVEAIETHLLDGYLYRQTVYFTSSGTFTKATYPWLRAIRATVVGGGGGGGGAEATGAGESAEAAGGGGGGYAVKFITDIAGLSASETITVGAGGSGGAAGSNDGVNGTASSAFGLTGGSGGYGEGGTAASAPTFSRNVGTNSPGTGGDLNGTGNHGGTGLVIDPTVVVGFSNFGGGTIISGSVGSLGTNIAGTSATANTGCGGQGARSRNQNAIAKAGGNGGSGIVIVELYA